MQSTKKYCSYNKYHFIYDTITNSFDVYYKKKLFVKNVKLENICDKTGSVCSLSKFSVSEIKHSVECHDDNAYITLDFSENESQKLYFTLRISVGKENVCVDILSDNEISSKLTGEVVCEENTNDIFPVCLFRKNNDFRCAVGKASTALDHAIYNRKFDYAISVGAPEQVEIFFNSNSNSYTFVTEISLNENVQISFKENILANMYDITFSPINKNSTFSKVPVGWMTWYAVKFDASQEKVLTNALWQSQNLKDYGADTIWVDWEWYHNAMPGNRSDGVNSLSPDLKMYPNGMKYVADKIKEMGLVPAIWMGLTNEPSKNKYIEKYPDMVLVDDITWCGRYYLDFSNPHYLNEYLPAALSNVHKWGYKAVKFDTIPIAFSRHEMYHDNMYDPSLTTYDAYRRMITKVRNELGKDMYMLSCSGSTNSSVLWASDIFESARIGEDIFTWDEYLYNIKRIADFYPLHNIQIYVDPDNVVMRDEFSDYEQAKSRVAIVSLLGLPMTFGDEFSALTDDKIKLIKKSLPVMDIHPADLCIPNTNEKKLLINLAIDKEFEKYHVAGTFNLTDKLCTQTIDIVKDLHLNDTKYIVYDFYRDTLIEINDNNISLDFVPYECRILALRQFTGKPQLISTSRHITQGAAEITDMKISETQIEITSSLVNGDPYTVTFYVPTGYSLKDYNGFDNYTFNERLLRMSFIPNETSEFSFCVSFEKTEL